MMATRTQLPATSTDAATNAVNDSTTEELVIDTTDPVIESVTSSTADGTYGIGAVIDIVIRMSEDVTVDTTLGSPTLTLDAGTGSFTSVAGNVLTFTYISQEGDNSSDLDVTALSLDGAVIEDAAGNAASFTAIATKLSSAADIVIDTTAPTAPTVTPDVTLSLLPVITGTTGTDAALPSDETLTVVIKGATYNPVADSNGDWSLNLATTQPVSGTLAQFVNGEYVSVLATVTDDAGNSASETTINEIGINTNPLILNVAPAANTPDDTYDINDEIDIVITLSQPVLVSGGVPTLTLNSGTELVDTSAEYVGDTFSYSETLLFRYKVRSGDDAEDLDYKDTDSLKLNGATIVNDQGNPLFTNTPGVPKLDIPGSVNSISFSNDIVVNTAPPSLERIETVVPDGSYGLGQTIPIVATLSEIVAPGQIFNVMLDTGRTVPLTTTSTELATGNYIIQAGDTSANLNVIDIPPASVVDSSGYSLLTQLPSDNLGSLKNIVIDSEAPTVVSFTTSKPDGLYGPGTTIDLTVTMSESVRAQSQMNVTLNTGAVVRVVASSAGTTLSGTYTVDGTDSAVDDLSVASYSTITVRDAAGNAIVSTALPIYPDNLGDGHDLEIDTAPPEVIEFTAEDGTYKAGDNIAITATLSEEINGTHDLKIKLSSGGFANLTIADGANIAVGNYTVQPGDTESDLTVDTIYAGSIVDFANSQLFTALPSGTNLGDTANIVLDTTAPTVESLTPDLTTINSTQNATIDITLSEDSTDFSIFDLNTTSGRFDPLSFSGSGSNYTVGFIPDADFEGDAVISVDNGSFNDTVGNAFDSTTPTLTIAVDSKAPTVDISADNTSLLAGDTSTLTLTLSEEAANGTDFGFADLAVSNGTLDINTFTPVTTTEYTVVYTPAPDFEGTVTFNIAGSTFSDTFLNPNEPSTDFNITVDTKVPTAAITSDLGTVNATQNATINISLSEASSFTGTGDVPAPGGSNDNEITNVDTANLAIGMTVSGGDIPAGATIVSMSGTGAGETITLSTPVVTGTGTTGASLDFEFEDFEFSDLIATNGTLDPATFTAINSTEFSVVFTPDAATTGDALISIAADSFKDLSGNNNSVESNLTIAVDTVAPTVVDVTPVLSTLNASQNTVVNINLSEDSADFTVDDLTATNGTFENGSFTGSGSNYSVVFVPDADIEDTAVVSVANGSLNDLAGNPLNSTAPNATLTLDTKVPTVDITPDDAALSIGENTTLTLTLSDAPGNASDFTFENLSASSGNLSTFTEVTATEYTVVYTPDADFEGNVTVLAAAGQFTDAALNPNAEGNLTLAVDTKAPTAEITSDINPVNGLQNATISITLSEDSSDFEFADLSATKGVLDPTSFTTISSTEYSVVFIPFSATTDNAVINIAADSFADGSGNNNSVESNLTHCCRYRCTNRARYHTGSF